MPVPVQLGLFASGRHGYDSSKSHLKFQPPTETIALGPAPFPPTLASHIRSTVNLVQSKRLGLGTTFSEPSSNAPEPAPKCIDLQDQKHVHCMQRDGAVPNQILLMPCLYDQQLSREVWQQSKQSRRLSTIILRRMLVCKNLSVKLIIFQMALLCM